MRDSKYLNYSVLCLLSVLFCGCGSGQPTVTGLVSLDGEPVAAANSKISGTVVFQPTGGGAKGVGTIDQQGRYSLYTGGQEGVAPGEYVVTVTVAEVVYSEDKNMPPYPRPIAPSRYGKASTSGFKYEVVPGSNTFDLPLESE